MYSGPGTVTFGNAAQAATTATFSQPGTYILMLSAADNVHAVAYDAVTVNVTLTTTGSVSGGNFVIQFPTLSGRTYRVQQSSDLTGSSWTTAVDNITGNGAVQQIAINGALANPRRFYRVMVLP
jgi:hypothetical protein